MIPRIQVGPTNNAFNRSYTSPGPTGRLAVMRSVEIRQWMVLVMGVFADDVGFAEDTQSQNAEAGAAALRCSPVDEA